MPNCQLYDAPPADNQDHLSTSSAWNSEITQRDEWIHLAAINDPETKTVTQYVNGVPMLRSSVDQLGISSIGAPWYIGGDLYQDGLPGHGFLGCIGETRLVADVLDEDQSLTQRVGDDTPSEPTEPSDLTEQPTTPMMQQMTPCLRPTPLRAT